VQQRGKPPSPLQRIKLALQRLRTAILTAPAKFKAYYGRLSKRAKIFLACQVLVLMTILGLLLGTPSSLQGGRKTMVRPVEVGYSTFLDLVDVNGKVSHSCDYFSYLFFLLLPQLGSFPFGLCRTAARM
jgi:hypothetical protein